VQLIPIMLCLAVGAFGSAIVSLFQKRWKRAVGFFAATLIFAGLGTALLYSWEAAIQRANDFAASRHPQ
jgi:TRAP-type C4-dicarboxylate transport system permease small subunit